jgi:hypothetical protein
MTTLRRLFHSRKARITFNVAFASVLLAVTVVSARHLFKGGWPLHHADRGLVVVSIALFLLAYAFKAWGW